MHTLRSSAQWVICKQHRQKPFKLPRAQNTKRIQCLSLYKHQTSTHSSYLRHAVHSCIKKRSLANGVNSFNEFSDHTNAVMGRIRIHLIVNKKVEFLVLVWNVCMMFLSRVLIVVFFNFFSVKYVIFTLWKLTISKTIKTFHFYKDYMQFCLRLNFWSS